MEHILSSWKEIAAYLGKGVRTVQRWEFQLGLPVRRPTAADGRIVFAIPAELDEWVAAGRMPSVNAELAVEALLQRIRALETENAELRGQLSRSGAALSLDARDTPSNAGWTVSGSPDSGTGKTA